MDGLDQPEINHQEQSSEHLASPYSPHPTNKMPPMCPVISHQVTPHPRQVATAMWRPRTVCDSLSKMALDRRKPAYRSCPVFTRNDSALPSSVPLSRATAVGKGVNLVIRNLKVVLSAVVAPANALGQPQLQGALVGLEEIVLDAAVGVDTTVGVVAAGGRQGREEEDGDGESLHRDVVGVGGCEDDV